MSCHAWRRKLSALWLLAVLVVCAGCPPANPDSARLRPHSATTTPGGGITTSSVFTTSAAGNLPEFGSLPAPKSPGVEVEGAQPAANRPLPPSAADAQGTSAAMLAGRSSPATAPAAVSARLVPIPLQLPAPAFRGTPVPLNEPNVEKPSGKPRPPFLAPEGTVNLALGKPVAASDPMPTAGELDMVTDGNKEASDFAYLELHSGTQWVQIDLGTRATIFAVVVWHNHAQARVYRDVVVQVSDDPDFLVAETVFNNDYDNSSGLGVGRDPGYVETSEGRLIDCRGLVGRYVRLWSRGNHMDAKNHCTEVEVYGIPLE